MSERRGTVVRRPITTEEKLEAYASALHSLIGTVVSMKQWAELGTVRPDSYPPMEVYEKIIALAEGRLEATNQRMEPVYRGFVRVEEPA